MNLSSAKTIIRSQTIFVFTFNRMLLNGIVSDAYALIQMKKNSENRTDNSIRTVCNHLSFINKLTNDSRTLLSSMHGTHTRAYGTAHAASTFAMDMCTIFVLSQTVDSDSSGIEKKTQKRCINIMQKQKK